MDASSISQALFKPDYHLTYIIKSTESQSGVMALVVLTQHVSWHALYLGIVYFD